MRTRGALALMLLGASGWCLLVPIAHALPAPSIVNGGAWRQWIDHTDPLTAAAALLRLAALVPTAILALALLVELLGTSSPRLRLRIPQLPGPLAAAVALVLGATACSAVAGSHPGIPGPRTLTISRIEAATVPPSRPPAPEPAPEPAPNPQPGPKRPPPTIAPTDRWETWDIQAGQCLWDVARETVLRRGGDPADNAAVVAYLQRVIAADRHELSDPGDPGLVFPGQVFDLPP